MTSLSGSICPLVMKNSWATAHEAILGKIWQGQFQWPILSTCPVLFSVVCWLLFMIAVRWYPWSSRTAGLLAVGIPKPALSGHFLLSGFAFRVHQDLLSPSHLGLVWSFFFFFIVWNVLDHRKCESLGTKQQRQETTRSSTCTASICWSQVSRGLSLTDVWRIGGKTVDPWTLESGLESNRGGPHRASTHWHREPGQSHLPPKKGHRKCVYVSRALRGGMFQGLLSLEFGG